MCVDIYLYEVQIFPSLPMMEISIVKQHCVEVLARLYRHVEFPIFDIIGC